MRKIKVAVLLLAAMIISVKADMHVIWDNLLGKYVEDGRVDYAGLKNNLKDMAKLEKYFFALGAADLNEFTHEARLAFWINAYNAFTVKLILDNYPVISIKKIERPWDRKSWFAAGDTLSLDDIEHKILRGQLKDSRIRFAIVCASIGGPDLKDRAFSKKNVDKQLDNAAKKFFKAEKNFVIDDHGATNTLYLSSIFKWFSSDFGGSDEEKLRYISIFLDHKSAKFVSNPQGFRIKYLDFDWSLNEKVRTGK